MPVQVHQIDGGQIVDKQDFFDQVAIALEWMNPSRVTNFDAFSDILGGWSPQSYVPVGAPEPQTVAFVLTGSEKARATLGYAATLAWLRDKLLRCHPSNMGLVLEEIDNAQRGEGPTVFDIFVEIFDECSIPLELA
jgi:hypothetical protein